MPANCKIRTMSCPVAINILWCGYAEADMDVIVFERSMHMVHIYFMTLFKQLYRLNFDLFFLLTTISRSTSNCTSARVGEQQVSGALTPDLPLTFFMDRHCCSKSHPSSSLVAARARLLHGCKAAPRTTASWILARPISHGLWPNRIQVTGNEWLTVGGLIGLFKSSQPDSLYPFRCT